MTLQSVNTGLDGSDIDYDMRTGLAEARDQGTEEDVVLPPVGGEQADVTVNVTPASATIDLSDVETQQLAVSVTDGQGRTQDVLEYCSFSSANEAIATVDSNGLITPTGVGGPINITATVMGQTDTCAITVVA